MRRDATHSLDTYTTESAERSTTKMSDNRKRDALENVEDQRQLKRQSRRGSEVPSDDVSEAGGSLVSLEWMGPVADNNSSAGVSIANPNRKYYNAARLRYVSKDEELIIRPGMVVRVQGSSNARKNLNSDVTNSSCNQFDLKWLCRVESLFSEEGKQLFNGRWFYDASDLEALLPKCRKGEEEENLREVLDIVRNAESPQLVLSNLEEPNALTAIQKVCSVIYRPTADEGSTAVVEDDQQHQNTFICAYRLNWDDELKSFTTHEIDTDEDVDAGADVESMSDTMVAGQNKDVQEDSSNRHENGHDEEDEDGGGDDDEDGPSAPEGTGDESAGDDTDNSVSPFSHVIQEGEGSALRGDIMIGERYQVHVGPFVPNQKVVSRKPTLVYKPGCLDNTDINQFSKDLSVFHTSYLRKQNLTTSPDEPYTPLPVKRAETLLRNQMAAGKDAVLTASSLCTAATMFPFKYSSDDAKEQQQRLTLLKECNIDEILAVLFEQGFNTKDAMTAIRLNPERVSSGWSATEREIFHDSYRRHQGSLRMVGKALAPTKNMKEVVDYFYRFKIPDQFRMYQNRKREQAIHLMELVEKRRQGTPIDLTGSSSTNNGNQDDNDDDPESLKWHDSTVEESMQQSGDAGSLSDRRRNAKQLLLEVEEQMGTDVLNRVAAGIQRLHSGYDREIKDKLLRDLRSQPDLQRRFLEFMPRDF